MNAVLVMVGAALGALARYSLTFVSLGSRSETSELPPYPWPTFTANVIASFLLGVIIRAVGSGTNLTAVSIVALLAVGFCGALSTMSTFLLEVMFMVRRGATVTALGYLTLSLGSALAAFWVGLALVQVTLG